jgi:hypothetical protein
MFQKIIIVLAAVMTYSVCQAQDVIVKKDGNTIVSKVIEVNKTDIRYKKFSNPNGPTYTIDIAEVLSVNYENGEKDTFSSPSSLASGQSETQSSRVVESIPAAGNGALIESYNSKEIKWIPNDKDKKGRYLYCQLKVTPNSVLEDENIKITMETGQVFGKDKELVFRPMQANYKEQTQVLYHYNPCISFSVSNKTNKTIYIDLGNTFIVRGGEAQPFFTPSATTTAQSTSSGVGVNLGAVAGAMGVGGAVGQLANGVSVSGGSSSGTATVEFSQRIISVPAMSTKTLSPTYFFTANSGFRFITFSNYPYAQIPKMSILNIKAGDVIHWNEDDSPMKFSFRLAYAFDEGFSTTYNTALNLYTSEVWGIARNANYSGWTVRYYEGLDKPLHFGIYNPMETVNAFDINTLNYERHVKK